MRRMEEILNDALELPERDRERIADSLLRSIGGEDEESVEQSWIAEAERRCAEIDEGKVELRPWAETMDRLKARYVR